MCCRSATQSVIGNPKQTCQTLNYSLIKFGGGQTVTGLKFAKIGNFWYKFSPKGYIRLSYFFTKFGLGQRISGPQHHAKFPRYGIKNVGLQPPKSPKIALLV